MNTFQVIRLLISWEDTNSEERLKNILGYNKAQDIEKYQHEGRRPG